MTIVITDSYSCFNAYISAIIITPSVLLRAGILLGGRSLQPRVQCFRPCAIVYLDKDAVWYNTLPSACCRLVHPNDKSRANDRGKVLKAKQLLLSGKHTF